MENTYEKVFSQKISVDEKVVQEKLMDEECVNKNKRVVRKHATVKVMIPPCNKLIEE
jgi:hypothetical protein